MKSGACVPPDLCIQSPETPQSSYSEHYVPQVAYIVNIWERVSENNIDMRKLRSREVYVVNSPFILW